MPEEVQLAYQLTGATLWPNLCGHSSTNGRYWMMVRNLDQRQQQLLTTEGGSVCILLFGQQEPPELVAKGLKMIGCQYEKDS